MSSQQGTIILPRFKAEYDITLNKVLSQLGMEIAFDPYKADFTKLYDKTGKDNVYISEARQKAFIEVNEEGTEAAAVTSIRMKCFDSVELPSKPFEMIVDRPFFCAISDNESGTILFMGAIVNPK
jgi:serine protease inhibitor